MHKNLMTAEMQIVWAKTSLKMSLACVVLDRLGPFHMRQLREKRRGEEGASSEATKDEEAIW